MTSLDDLDRLIDTVASREVAVGLQDGVLLATMENDQLSNAAKIGQVEQIFEERAEPNWTRHGKLFREVRKKWNLPYAAGSVLDGWADIIDNLCEEISRFGWRGDMLAQISEKYGELCFYTRDPEMDVVQTKAFDRAIQKAEFLCLSCCEKCGRPGRIRIEGVWLSTRCDFCAKAKKTIHGKTAIGVTDKFGVRAGFIRAGDGWAELYDELLATCGEGLRLVAVQGAREMEEMFFVGVEGGLLSVLPQRDGDRNRDANRQFSADLANRLGMITAKSQGVCEVCGGAGERKERWIFGDQWDKPEVRCTNCRGNDNGQVWREVPKGLPENR